MNAPNTGESEFRVLSLDPDESESGLNSILVEYVPSPACYAEYSKGVELETAEGEVMDDETIGIDMIHVTEDMRGKGIGTGLLKKIIEEARASGYRYLRTGSIVNPVTVKVIEKVLRESGVGRRAYRIHTPEEDMADLPSRELIKLAGEVTPEQAAEAVPEDAEFEQGDDFPTRVECVGEL